MKNTALTELIHSITELFPGKIKVFPIALQEKCVTGISNSLLHKNFSQPLNTQTEMELAEQMAIYLRGKNPGQTYTYFYRVNTNKAIREWKFCSARLSNEKDLLTGIITFTYDLSVLSEEKKRLYKVLDNDLFFKEHLNKIASLTKRETEIAGLLSGGWSNRQIALKSNTSEHTVNTHRKNINQKLGIQNLAGLLRFADVFDFTNPLPA
ncbi:MAG: response regulator transcription factor [Chitinophagaceae bacterium]